MKTLKDMFEVYRPKSPDEQKFVDKHVTIKHKDRNEVNGKANGDDVFNATNVKPVDRKKTNYGYDVGADEKVYEENEFYVEDNLDEAGYGNKDIPYNDPEMVKRRAIQAYLDKEQAAKKAGVKKVLSKLTKEETAGRKALAKEDIINRAIDKYMPEVADIKALTIEQRLAKKIDGLSEGHTALLFSLFTNLNENNQMKMIEACSDRDGINGLIDFALENRGE